MGELIDHRNVKAVVLSVDEGFYCLGTSQNGSVGSGQAVFKCTVVAQRNVKIRDANAYQLVSNATANVTRV